MRSALEVVGFLVGLAVIVAVLLSTIQAVVLPRASQARLPTITTSVVRWTFRLRARRITSFEERDRILAMVPPVALLALLGLWLLTIVAAYTLMFFSISGRSLSASIMLSGSSVFTLGTSSDPRLGPSIMTYTEAALGLLLVALFITYFPSIYNAFSRREAGVALFEVRAGDPPRPAAMLVRYHRIEGTLEELHELWKQWEAWFADIEETHTTFPILVFFRSPQPQRNWVTAAGVLLDGASLWSACVEHHARPRRATVHTGRLPLLAAHSRCFPYRLRPRPRSGRPHLRFARRVGRGDGRARGRGRATDLRPRSGLAGVVRVEGQLRHRPPGAGVARGSATRPMGFRSSTDRGRSTLPPAYLSPELWIPRPKTSRATTIDTTMTRMTSRIP